MFDEKGRNVLDSRNAYNFISFVLVSHGESGEGAYSPVGKRIPVKPAAKPSQKTNSAASPALSDLFLSAILYVDQDHWTVWINDHPFRHADEVILEGFEVVSVTGNEVTFNQEGNSIIIQPHQTYWPQENRILNGDHRRTGKQSD